MWKLPDEDLEALIRSFESSDWKDLRLSMDGVELVLAKGSAPQWHEIPMNEAGPATTRREPADAEPPAQSAAVGGPATRAPDAIPEGWMQVRAPSLGTFYRAPKPGTPPFVEVGSAITADSEVCLIEVMKLFTTVRAGIKGIVRKVYPADADLVEFNQPLFLIEP